MLKIIDTQKVIDPNVFAEILKEAIFEQCTSHVDLRPRRGFTEIPLDSQQGRMIVSIFGLYFEQGVTLEERDVCWTSFLTNKKFVLSKLHMYRCGDIFTAWLWDGSGHGSVLVGEGKKIATTHNYIRKESWKWACV